jgi:hypothetical protein
LCWNGMGGLGTSDLDIPTIASKSPVESNLLLAIFKRLRGDTNFIEY